MMLNLNKLRELFGMNIKKNSNEVNDIFDSVMQEVREEKKAESDSEKALQNKMSGNLNHLTLQQALVLFIFTTFIFKVTTLLLNEYMETMTFSYLKNSEKIISLTLFFQQYLLSIALTLCILFLYYLCRLALYMFNFQEDTLLNLHFRFNDFIKTILRVFVTLPFVVYFSYQFLYYLFKNGLSYYIEWNEIFIAPIWLNCLILAVILYVDAKSNKIPFLRNINPKNKLFRRAPYIILVLFSMLVLFYQFNTLINSRLSFQSSVYKSSEESSLVFETNHNVQSAYLQKKYTDYRIPVKVDSYHVNRVYVNRINFEREKIYEGVFTLALKMSSPFSIGNNNFKQELVYITDDWIEETSEKYVDRYIFHLRLLIQDNAEIESLLNSLSNLYNNGGELSSLIKTKKEFYKMIKGHENEMKAKSILVDLDVQSHQKFMN